MKTIHEWLKELPQDIYERALAYEIRANSVSSLSDAVTIGFSWAQSSEGVNFWYFVAGGDYDNARALLKPEPSPERELIRGFIEVTLLDGGKRLYNVSTICGVHPLGEKSGICIGQDENYFAVSESYETVKELIKEATL